MNTSDVIQVLKDEVLRNLVHGKRLEAIFYAVESECRRSFPELATRMMPYLGMRISHPDPNYVIAARCTHLASTGELYSVLIAFGETDPCASFFIEVSFIFNIYF
jgi:hypothetical protein